MIGNMPATILILVAIAFHSPVLAADRGYEEAIYKARCESLATEIEQSRWLENPPKTIDQYNVYKMDILSPFDELKPAMEKQDKDKTKDCTKKVTDLIKSINDKMMKPFRSHPRCVPNSRVKAVKWYSKNPFKCFTQKFWPEHKPLFGEKKYACTGTIIRCDEDKLFIKWDHLAAKYPDKPKKHTLPTKYKSERVEFINSVNPIQVSAEDEKALREKHNKEISGRCLMCFEDDVDEMIQCPNKHLMCTDCMTNWLNTAGQACPTCKHPARIVNGRIVWRSRRRLTRFPRFCLAL